MVLIAISTDNAAELAAWARDEEFPFLFGSDPEAEAGRRFGAVRPQRDGGFIDNRTLYVVDPQGKVAYRAAPFREIDPAAYEELEAAVERIAGPAPRG